MTLILPQTKFEAIPLKDAEGDTFLAKAHVSRQMLEFFVTTFFP